MPRVLKLDLSPSRGILRGSQLRREWDGRRPRPWAMPFGSRLGVGDVDSRPTSLDHRNRLAGRDRRRVRTADVVGDIADDARMRPHLPLRPRALPPPDARQACQAHGRICGVEEHRRPWGGVARQVRLFVFARAPDFEGGQGGAARRAAAEYRRGTTRGHARQAGHRDDDDDAGKQRGAFAICDLEATLGRGYHYRHRRGGFVLFAGDGSPAARACTASTCRRHRQGARPRAKP